jgi:hypothetical protein
MPVGKDVLIIKNVIVFIRHMQPKTDILCGRGGCRMGGCSCGVVLVLVVVVEQRIGC